MSGYKDIRSDIYNLNDLPLLAESSGALLDSINDAEISLNKLCDILETEPSLTARLLKLANSAYFGYRGTVDSIKQAVIQVLGLNLTKSLAIGILISDVLDTRGCPAFSGQKYWFSALTTGILAKQFCIASPLLTEIDPSLGYTAGLLHNIGLLALVHRFPDLMAKVFQKSAKSGRGISEILQEAYSLDQYQAGGWLAGRWQFPNAIRVAVKEHRNPHYTGPFQILATLIGTASHVASQSYREIEIGQEIMDRTATLKISASDRKKIFVELQSSLENFQSLAGILSGKQK